MNEKKDIRIKQAMLSANEMTQAELSKKTRIPVSYINWIINGKWKPSHEEKAAIAEALSKTIEDLF